MAKRIKELKNSLLSFQPLNVFLATALHPKFLIGVILIAFNKKEEVLLTKATWQEKFKWRLPGGLVNNKDKDLGSALIREIQEELGLSLRTKNLKLYTAVKNSHPPRIDLYFLYQSRLTTNFQLGHEVKETRFFKLHRLPQSIFTGQGVIIKKASALVFTKD